jgi:hypothetical protein
MPAVTGDAASSASVLVTRALAGNRSAAARAGSVAGLQPARITVTVLYVGSSLSRVW